MVLVFPSSLVVWTLAQLIHNYLVHKNSTIVARYTVISNTIHYVRIIYISCYTTKCVMLNGDCHFNMYLYYTIYHIWVLLRCHGTYSVMCNGEWKSVECVVWTQAFVQIQILCIRHVDSWVINNDTNTCTKSKPNNHQETDCVIICLKWEGDYGLFSWHCVLTDRSPSYLTSLYQN